MITFLILCGLAFVLLTIFISLWFIFLDVAVCCVILWGLWKLFFG